MPSSWTLALWRGFAVLVVAAGALSALVLWGWQGPLIVTVGLGLMGVGLVSAMVPAHRIRRLLHYWGAAFLCSAGIVTAAGLVAAAPAAGGAVLVLLVCTCPPVVRLVGRRWARARSSSFDLSRADAIAAAERIDDPERPLPRSLPVGEGVAGLDDLELCLCWRRSYPMLEHVRSAAGLGRIVTARQQYLDELERRHPREVSSWLASGPRAAGNPYPFLHDRGRGSRRGRPAHDSQDHGQ